MNNSNYKIYKKIRKTWEISPVEKIKDSNKKYDRNKSKNELRKEIKENYNF